MRTPIRKRLTTNAHFGYKGLLCDAVNNKPYRVSDGVILKGGCQVVSAERNELTRPLTPTCSLWCCIL